MKKILLLVVFISVLSCSKSISQISAIKAITAASQIKPPYGDKDVLREFPADWTSSKESIQQDSLYNKLSRFLFEDLENPIRSTFETDYVAAKVLLSKEFIPSADLKNKKTKIELKSAKILDEKEFSVFSIIYIGKIDCKTCEYPEKQTQNVLLSIKDGKVTDKLLVSYINGSDLGQSTRYFYMDSNTIHLKDFKSDESGVTFTQYLKYTISPDGKFIKIK